MLFHLWNPLSGLYFVDEKLSSFWGPLQASARIGWGTGLIISKYRVELMAAFYLYLKKVK
jgi:hypothetical protein